MNIIHNKINNTLEIKDNIKSQYFLYRLLMILNIINATLQTFNIGKTGLNFMNGIWIFVGIISLITLCYLIFKKTGKSKISISEILKLDRKKSFNGTQYMLLLKNGKQRDLGSFKSAENLAKLKQLMSDLDISFSK